tara:strand:+ start:833 stop:1021 length:189 start_codon:yes stop_codon:yes gene_type:complete
MLSPRRMPEQVKAQKSQNKILIYQPNFILNCYAYGNQEVEFFRIYLIRLCQFEAFPQPFILP